jgi:hypothetical protein
MPMMLRVAGLFPGGAHSHQANEFRAGDAARGRRFGLRSGKPEMTGATIRKIRYREYHGPDMKPHPEASTQEVLAGLVERVTFHNAENGFCVLRAKARGHRELVTVIGHAAAIAAGEWVTASGEWVNDRTHGQQFKARFLRTSPPTSADCRPSSVGVPPCLSIIAALPEVDLDLRVDNPCKRNVMILAACVLIVLRQLDLIRTFHVVHGPNMCTV